MKRLLRNAVFNSTVLFFIFAAYTIFWFSIGENLLGCMGTITCLGTISDIVGLYYAAKQFEGEQA